MNNFRIVKPNYLGPNTIGPSYATYEEALQAIIDKDKGERLDWFVEGRIDGEWYELA